MKMLLIFISLISVQSFAQNWQNPYAINNYDGQWQPKPFTNYEMQVYLPQQPSIQQSQQPDYGFRGSFPAYHVPESIQNEGIDE